MVGQRMDTPIANKTNLLDFATLEGVARETGRLHSTAAIDYFFMARNDYPWHRVPDVVVGRPSYDNFIVSARERYVYSFS